MTRCLQRSGVAWAAATLLTFISLAGPARAQTRTWLGTTSATWGTASNWSGNAVPTSATPVVFDSSSTNLGPGISATANAKGITVANPSGPITISNTSTLSIAGGIDLSAATQNLTIGTDFLSGTVNVTASGTLSVPAGRTLAIGARLLNFNSSSATYTIEGPGAITVTGTAGMTVGGPLTIRSGSFVSSYQCFANQPVTLQGGYFGMNSNDANNFIVSNTGTAGSFTQSSGTSFFSRLQVRTAPVTITGGSAWLGALQLGTAANVTSSLTISGSATASGTWGANFGNANNAVANVTLSGGTLAMNTMPSGTNATATRSITFDGGVLQPLSGTGVTLVQNMTNAWVTNNGAIIDTNGFNAAITQALTNGTAAGTLGSFTKRGVGTLTLTGVNTFSGTTTVNGGRLLISNAGNLAGTARTVVNGAGAELTWASTATLAGPIDVAAGTLSGTGGFGGLVTLGSSGILSPGASAGVPGTLTMNGGLVLNASSSLNFDLNANDTTVGGGINDLVAVGGSFTLGGILNVTGTGDFAAAADFTSWTLFTYAGGAFTDTTLTLGSMPALGSPGRSFRIDTGTPGQVLLTIVPEPTASVAAAATLGLAVLVRFRRRQRP